MRSSREFNIQFDRRISLAAVEKMNAHPRRIPVIKWVNFFLTYVNILAYPLLLIYLIVQKDPLLYRAIVVPLDGFIILSVIRFFINRKRPYESLDFAPVIPKKTKGKSFPSRHVFSATVIAMTFLLWSPFWWIGLISLAISLALAVVRVFTGLHYLSDVVVGLLAGALCGMVGYWFIP